MIHKGDDERQVAGRRAALEQGQDKFSARGGEAVVGVLRAVGNRREGPDITDFETGEEGSEVCPPDLGVDRHGTVSSGGQRRRQAEGDVLLRDPPFLGGDRAA